MKTSFLLLAAALPLFTSNNFKLEDKKAAKGSWQKWSAGCPERFAHSVVWDSKHEKFLVFGGQTQKNKKFESYFDLWEFTPRLDRWKEVEVKGSSPSKFAWHAAAWDSQQNAMWIFGGVDLAGIPLKEMWKFDSEKNTWDRIRPTGTSPEEGFYQGMHYDPKGNQLILFNGLIGNSKKALANLWFYDIAKNTWAKKETELPARQQYASDFDPENGILVVNGGFEDMGAPSANTWVYDLKSGKWKNSTPSPKATNGHTLVCNPQSGEFILFGGAQEKKVGLDEVWSFSPKTGKWNRLSPVAPDPGPRAFHAAAWNATDKNMFVFGGTVNRAQDALASTEAWVLTLPLPKK